MRAHDDPMMDGEPQRMGDMDSTLEYRSPTQEDADAIADLINICAIETTGKPSITARTVLRFLRMPGHDLAQDARLAFDSRGHLIGFALLEYSAPNTTLYLHSELHPRYHGHSVGASLCQWGEARARRLLPSAPEDEPVVIMQKKPSTDSAAQSRLNQLGYSIVRHSYRMVLHLDSQPPEPAIPPGFHIRPFDRRSESRAMVRVLQEAFRDHWGYAARSPEEEYERWMHLLDEHAGQDLAPFWLVALEEDRVVGVCLGNPREQGDPDMAWVHALGVLPEYRRKGLALALLRHNFGAFYRLGRNRAGLEVDAESKTGATQLYNRAGMAVDRRYDIYQKRIGGGLSTD